MNSCGRCRECGAAIPADNPGGFCAQCLFGLGLGLGDEERAAGGEGPGTECRVQNEGAALSAVYTAQGGGGGERGERGEDQEQSEPHQSSPAGGHKDSGGLGVRLTEKPGDRIGRYRLLEEIGHGGCGVVYMAEQQEPVRREVALKVIKLGMDTKQVVARFDAERQALALMDHSNIARVLDAGATEAGRPYFVMELVGGIRITDFCDQNHLTIRERLELFTQVCRAIQHAHQKGIIHRDIKPSNVLVATQDGVAVPKVIDFGIAKATQGRLTDQTLFTAFEQFVGTPAYMSPEQAQLGSLDVDTRSDIYSLGVLLYELLTSKTPFDTKELVAAGLDEMRRTIREVEPVKPSTRLTQELAARSAGSDKSALRTPHSALDKDLDWIVMKCLEKDRARRYETANGLAMDLTRHLNNEPVVARPPSKLYEFQKTVRRHKVGFAATISIMFVLAMGGAVATWEAVRARRAEAGEKVQWQQAQENARRAERLAEQNRQNLYAAHIGLARQVFEDGDVGYAVQLLQSLKPKAGEEDLRGFEWYYMWRLCHGEKLELHHLSRVDDLACSPDGRMLAVACRDHSVSLWDVTSGRQLFRLPGQSQEVCSVAFSPDGSLLAAGSIDKTIRLWAVTNGMLVGILTGHAEGVRALAFSPDGSTLASGTAVIARAGGNPSERYRAGSSKGEIKLWDVNSQRERWNLPARASPILRLAFSPDGTMLLAGSCSSLDLWETTSGSLRHSLTNFVGDLRDFAIQPGTRTAAVATWYGHSNDGEVKLWNLDSFAVTTLALRKPGRILCLAFSPDGKQLATSGVDSVINLWDSQTGAELGRFAGHTREVWRLAFANGGQWLASGGWDFTARVWDLNQPQKPQVIHTAISYTTDFSPDGRYLASGGRGAEVREVATGQLVRTLLEGTNYGDVVVRFSPDGKYLAAIGIQGDVHFWDVESWGHRAPPSPHAGWGHVMTIDDLIFTPDGCQLITGSSELWDVAAARPISHAGFRGVEGWAKGFDAEAGTFLTVGYSVKEITLWDAVSFARRTNQPAPSVGLYWSILSPDGKELAVLTDHDREVVLLAMPEGREIHRLRGHKDWVWITAYSHDGKTLATGSWDGTVRLWQRATGRELMKFRSPGGPVWSVTFSPDDRTLAFGSGAGNIQHGSISILRADPQQDISQMIARSNATARVMATYHAAAEAYRETMKH